VFLGNKSINCCEKRLTVSVFGILNLTCFRTSNYLLAFLSAPLVLLYESLARALYVIEQTKTDRLSFYTLGYYGLVFN
jgi:branched-subunit amino acid transport protein AzlD